MPGSRLCQRGVLRPLALRGRTGAGVPGRADEDPPGVAAVDLASCASSFSHCGACVSAGSGSPARAPAEATASKRASRVRDMADTWDG